MVVSRERSVLVARLGDALEARGVSYCHWKSNAAIARSESGLNDLDLLIARRHARTFREVAAEVGFVRVARRAPPALPGKEDYFGHDDRAGRLVHIDAHYQLAVGHDRTKNYRIPLESAFLASAERRGLLRIPAPELEYVLFLIRMVLKYGVWDEVAWQAMRGHRCGLKPSERDELSHLEASLDRRRLAETVRSVAPWLAAGLLDDGAALAHGEVGLVERIAIGRRFHHALAPHARHSELIDTPVRIARRTVLAAQRRTGHAPKFQPAGGGAVIAIVGGDGSGKSTAVARLGGWLGAEFDVRQMHLGRPRWSATTYAVRGALKLAKLAHDVVADAASHRSSPSPGSDRDYRTVAWLACTARDRYLTYRRARRFASRGGIVVSDRYPLPVFETMDVPQIARLEEPHRFGRIVAALGRLEWSYHERIDPPDILVVLSVDPMTAALRKTDEPDDYVRRRVTEVANIDWEAAAVPVIDAARPRDVVAGELESLIWRELA